MKKSNKLLLTIMIGSLAFFAFAIISFAQTSKLNQSNFVASFYSAMQANGGIKQANVSRVGLVKVYCNNLFSPTLIDGFDDSNSLPEVANFSPQDSLFVRLICERANSSLKDKSRISSDYLNFTSYNKLFVNTGCDWSSNLNGCNFSSYFSKIFHTIINDYTNSAIASIYGYTNKLSDNPELNSVSISQSIKNFSDLYFDYCNNEVESTNIYLNEKQGPTACSHPNTYKMLSNYIENAQEKIKNNQIIDYNSLLEKKGDKRTAGYQAFHADCATVVDGESLSCSIQYLQHLMLNELFYYGLFMNMYASIIPNNQQFGELTLGRDNSASQEILNEEVWKTQLELKVAKSSVQNTIKIIRNLYAQFPVHIGLVAYLEDLVGFRNELVKLYTPIHQLYFKLRNAQSYEK